MARILLIILNIAVLTIFKSKCLDAIYNTQKLDFDINKFRQEILECHNNIRKLHGVPALTYVTKMDQSAQKHANYLANKNGGLEFSNDFYEENALESTCITSGCTVCSMWYDNEAALYNYSDDNPDVKIFGHFTRMVWKTTRYIGLGVAKSYGKTYVVCQYDPPGNREYSYENNILSPSRKLTVGSSAELCYKDIRRLPDNDLPDYSSVIAQMREQNLACHNHFRQKHGVAPLISDSKLNERAQKEAEWNALHDVCWHNKNNAFPYSALCTNKREVSGYTACKHFYNESLQYVYSSNDTKNLNLARHFVKLIWKNSNSIGFGMAKSKTGKTCIYLIYEPCYTRQSIENVLPPVKTESDTELFLSDLGKPNSTPDSTNYLDSATITKLNEESLQCHNSMRQKRGLKPLVFSCELTQNAQKHADWLAKLDKDVSVASNTSFGESVYTTKYVKNISYSACKALAKEDNKMWKFIGLIGFGVAKSKSGLIFIVTQFDLSDEFYENSDESTEFETEVETTTTSEVGSQESFSGEVDSFEFVTKTPVTLSKIMTQNLECHNNFRHRHGSKPLTYKTQLNNLAQSLAQTLAHEGRGLKHSNNNRQYGENLYSSIGFSVSGYSACKTWYSEFRMYDYDLDNPEDLSSVGHFTQMLWRNTRYIGFGMASSKIGKTYIVCVYDPPGNLEYEFEENVLRPGNFFNFFSGGATSLTNAKWTLLIMIVCLLSCINF